MDVLNDPFAPKAPPKRTKTGALHHFNTLKASGVISLVLLAIDAVIIGQYLARYSGLTLDICLSGHPKEDKICETYVFEILGVTVVGLFFALLAGATVQGYSSERMDRVLQSVGAGIVGGFAGGMRAERQTCVTALERIHMDDGQGSEGSCLPGMRIGVLGSMVMLVVLLVLDQMWFQEKSPKEEELPGAKLD